MLASLSVLFQHAAQLLLGGSIGFVTVVVALRQWLALSGTPHGRNYPATLRRLAVQYSLASIVITAVAGYWLSRHLPGHTAFETVRAAMWGLPLGLSAG